VSHEKRGWPRRRYGLRSSASASSFPCPINTKTISVVTAEDLGGCESSYRDATKTTGADKAEGEGRGELLALESAGATVERATASAHAVGRVETAGLVRRRGAHGRRGAQDGGGCTIGCQVTTRAVASACDAR